MDAIPGSTYVVYVSILEKLKSWLELGNNIGS